MTSRTAGARRAADPAGFDPDPHNMLHMNDVQAGGQSHQLIAVRGEDPLVEHGRRLSSWWDEFARQRGGVPDAERLREALLVAELVTFRLATALADNSNATLADPEAVAEAISGIVVDSAGGPDRNELAGLLAPYWTASRTAQALGGLARSTMTERRRTGSLLGLRTTDGDFFYPIAQFETHGGKVRVKPALRTFFMTLRAHDRWAVGVMLHTPAPELDGLTPLAWAGQRRDPEVLAGYARMLDAEWSS
jgi:hypothetical protein